MSVLLISSRARQRAQVSTEHVTNHRAVRETLLKRGIQPELLAAAEDVKKVERRLASEEKRSLKNPDCLAGDDDLH